jgi:hypothetical protein
LLVVAQDNTSLVREVNQWQGFDHVQHFLAECDAVGLVVFVQCLIAPRLAVLPSQSFPDKIACCPGDLTTQLGRNSPGRLDADTDGL